MLQNTDLSGVCLVLVLRSVLLHRWWKIIGLYCFTPCGFQISQMVRFPCKGVFCLVLPIFQSCISNEAVAVCNPLGSEWLCVPVCSFDDCYCFSYLTEIQTLLILHSIKTSSFQLANKCMNEALLIGIWYFYKLFIFFPHRLRQQDIKISREFSQKSFCWFVLFGKVSCEDLQLLFNILGHILSNSLFQCANQDAVSNVRCSQTEH